MGKNVYVVVHDTKWGVRLEGDSELTSVHDTQKQAEDAARILAKREKSELLVQGENGQFRSKDSFGNDPASIIDREH